MINKRESTSAMAGKEIPDGKGRRNITIMSERNIAEATMIRRRMGEL